MLACRIDLGSQSTVHALSDYMQTVEIKRHGTELLSLRQASRNRPDGYQQERPQPKTKQAVPFTMLRKSLLGITFLDVATRRFIFRQTSQRRVRGYVPILLFSADTAFIESSPSFIISPAQSSSLSLTSRGDFHLFSLKSKST